MSRLLTTPRHNAHFNFCLVAILFRYVLFIVLLSMFGGMFALAVSNVGAPTTSDSVIINEYGSDNDTLRYNAFNSFPICEQQWNGNLSVIDITSLTAMAYSIHEDASLQPMTMQQLMWYALLCWWCIGVALHTLVRIAHEQHVL